MDSKTAETAKYFRNPADYYEGITRLWNYLDAVKMLDWNSYISSGSAVLDLAGGVGWLTAYLSRLANITKIYNLDSSRYSLSVMMPALVELMNGKEEKIEAIEGLFYPLLFDNNSLDVVVASSSLHHADNMVVVLKEINRVLKNGGHLFILNETPHTSFKYMVTIGLQFLSTMKNTVMTKYRDVSPHISSSGFLYDPYLGDKSYPLWSWKAAIGKSRFSLVDIINTRLITVKAHRRGMSLVHFICRKDSSAV